MRSVLLPLAVPALALVLGCSGCGACGKSPPPAVQPVPAVPAVQAPPAELPQERPGRPELVRGALGVNEGVSIPTALLSNGTVKRAQESQVLDRDIALLKDLGVGIVRANTSTYPFLSWFQTTRRDPELSRADRWVRQVQASQLEPLLMIGPWPGNQTANYTQRYVPEDLDAYGSWVQAVVERYDGDGIDDMPGLLRPVHLWEVDNEPDLHNTVEPRGAKAGHRVDPADFETPQQYAQVLVATAAAIRRADPQAVVLSAGLYRPHADQGRAYLEAVLAEPGAREAFDVLSLHCYFHEDDLGKLQRTLATWKATVPDKPLWITETGVPAEDRAPHVDAEWQGRMVAATYGAFLAGGADRVLWHTLMDPPPSKHARRSPFATHSLLQQDGAGSHGDKPAGAVYRRLSQYLGPASHRSLQEEPSAGGRLLRSDRGWLAFWGEPEPPAGATQYVDLLSGQVHPVGTKVPSPAWIPLPAAPIQDAPAPAGG